MMVLLKMEKKLFSTAMKDSGNVRWRLRNGTLASLVNASMQNKRRGRR
jgi:hypothetical protein